MYKYMEESWKDLKKEQESSREYAQRRARWRKGPTIARLDKPSRLGRARQLGYKDKPGYVTARVKVSRGGQRKTRPKMGRRQKAMGVEKIKRGKSMKKIAEEKALRKFGNLEALGSYELGSDGKSIWFEVVLVDPEIAN